MHEKRFNREIERLRDNDRINRLEVDRVVSLTLKNGLAIEEVLDIGTGSGVFAEKFFEKGCKLTGLDVNPEMLVAAREFVPTGIFREGIAEKLPFLDGSFDLVFMGLVLHETDDLHAAVSEAYRVTRRRFAILEWPDEEQEFGPPLSHRIPKQKLIEICKNCGFPTVTQIRLTNLILYLCNR